MINERNPMNSLEDCALVFFTDGRQLVGGVWLPDVGDELPQLLTGAIKQAVDQGMELGPGTAAAAFVYRALATANYTEVVSAPMLSSYSAQIASLFLPESAVGGVGTVLVDVSQDVIVTYGGRGFPELFEGAIYQQVIHPLADVQALEEKDYGEPPEDPPSTLPVKKKAKKKAKKKKKAPKRKRAAVNAVSS